MDQVQESELQEGHMKVSARTSGCSQTERGFTVPDSDRGLTVPDLHTAPGRCVMIVLAQPESGVNRTFDGLFPVSVCVCVRVFIRVCGSAGSDGKANQLQASVFSCRLLGPHDLQARPPDGCVAFYCHAQIVGTAKSNTSSCYPTTTWLLLFDFAVNTR